MPNIPAICNNPNCGAIFPSSFNLLGTDNVFISCTTGPCPKCGSDGRIPDGKYDAFNDAIFGMLYNVGDVAIINKAINLIRSQVSSQKSPAEIIDKAKAEIPQLQSLWDLIPKTRTEAYAFITLLLLFLKFFLDLNPNAKAPTSNVVNIQQQIINQSFEQFYSSSTPASPAPQQDIRKKTNKTKSQKLKKYERNKHKRR